MIFSLIIIIGIFLYINNNKLSINTIVYENHKIQTDFNGFKIIHLSDLHNKSFGKNQSKLIAKINTLNPDIIVITGDIINSHKKDTNNAFILLNELTKLYPIYYVPGNHEARRSDYQKLLLNIENLGIIVLNNTTCSININNSKINIYGLEYDFFNCKNHFSTDILKSVDEKYFNILLSHGPHYFDYYAKFKFDLIFSGHEHGGQFRIPLIKKGIYAPSEGLFPKFSEGIHRKHNSTLIVSRGLGNSRFPFRLFNLPEILLIEFKTSKL